MKRPVQKNHFPEKIANLAEITLDEPDEPQTDLDEQLGSTAYYTERHGQSPDDRP